MNNVVSMKKEALPERIIFENAGEIDIRSITTFGVSSKENDKAIGFFGTGLKYAIAVLLREGLTITIYSGEEKYEFSSILETIRVNEFNIIRMNDQPLGFTTDLGKAWKLWQAYRELYCNCVDESGKIYKSTFPPSIGAGKTVIVVEGEKILEQHRNLGDVLILTKPIFKSEDCDIHQGSSEYTFYKNIRVRDDLRSFLTYNLKKKIDLTEDRTAKYNHQVKAIILDAIISCHNEEIIRDALMAPEHLYIESLLTYGEATNKPSDQFLEVVYKLSKDPTIKYNRSSLVLARKYNLIQQEEDVVELSAVNKQKLEKAINFLKNLKYSVDSYPIKILGDMVEGFMGEARDGTIYLSVRLFDKGTKEVATTILEEYIHLKYKVWDYSREMQNLLFETITSMGEEILGESL